MGELREILRHLVFDYTKEEIDTNKPFDQVTTKIKALFKSKLPKRKADNTPTRNIPLTESDILAKYMMNFGFNSALTEIEKILDSL